MVDLTAEDDGEASEWDPIDNYITLPRQRGLRPRKARVGSCKDRGGDEGGDKNWESEND